MATPSEKLAESLDTLRRLQNDDGFAVVKSTDLSRTHKERLVKNGFLYEVIKGWYITSRPEVSHGDTTVWYTSYWAFMRVYLESRFGNEWCLSPEQSLKMLGGNRQVPLQILVRSPKARNAVTNLLFKTSILDIKAKMPDKADIVKENGLNLFSLESGLIACGSDFFNRNPTDARTCLYMVKDESVLLGKLLDGGHSTIAGTLAGAFRNVGKDKIADAILSTMKTAGYDVRENDPFAEKTRVTGINFRETSPYVNRIRLMWYEMREGVIANFPAEKGAVTDIAEYLKDIEEHYVDDAYNSLSIEGYQVTDALIEQVRTGSWNPDKNDSDRQQRDAMVARGYYQAFQAVKASIKSIIEGKSAGEVAENDHSVWYRELFAPSVTSGLLKPSDLAGYRNNQVYIKGSLHTPLNKDAVRDAMPTLFELLREEENAGVRAVLGHFIFVYIHPYMDGNGRIGRFLFNAMLASGGYSWTVVPVKQRNEYMQALEKASVNGDITVFAKFLGELVSVKK